jgi:hypothetical protein
VAGFQSYSQYHATQQALKYVEECKAMANTGLMHESEAQLAVMERGTIQRDSKDWPWQEGIKK